MKLYKTHSYFFLHTPLLAVQLVDCIDAPDRQLSRVVSQTAPTIQYLSHSVRLAARQPQPSPHTRTTAGARTHHHRPAVKSAHPKSVRKRALDNEFSVDNMQACISMSKRCHNRALALRAYLLNAVVVGRPQAYDPRLQKCIKHNREDPLV